MLLREAAAQRFSGSVCLCARLDPFQHQGGRLIDHGDDLGHAHRLSLSEQTQAARFNFKQAWASG